MEAVHRDVDAWGQTPDEVAAAVLQLRLGLWREQGDFFPGTDQPDADHPDLDWWPFESDDSQNDTCHPENWPPETWLSNDWPDQLVEPVTTAAEVPVWQLGDADVIVQFTEIQQQISRLRARQARLLVEWQRRQPTTGRQQTIAEQIHSSHRCTLKAARTQVLQADQLHQHPLILDAVESGAASYDQAIAAVTGLRALPDHLTADQRSEAEAHIVQRLGEFDPTWIRQLAKRVVAIVAPDADDISDAEHLARQESTATRDRYLIWQFDGDGSVDFRGRLPVTDAEPLLAAITALAQAPRGDDQTIFDRPSLGQRRADALARLARLALQTPDLPAIGGSRPRVIVTMSLQALLTGLGTASVGHHCFDEPVTINPGTARRMACDADLIPVVLGGRDEPLAVGRTHRLVTPAIRTALMLRDGGCVFPGCDRPSPECDAHHLIPWWAGGETKLSNLALLCPHHHMVVEPDRDAHHNESPALDNPHRWRIRINRDDGVPECLPPAHVDPEQRPRRHARHRLRE